MTRDGILEQLRYHYDSAKSTMAQIRKKDLDPRTLGYSGQLTQLIANTSALELHAQTMRLLARQLEAVVRRDEQDTVPGVECISCGAPEGQPHATTCPRSRAT